MPEHSSKQMTDERKVEILEALMDDSLWGLVSVDMDRSEGIILYERGCSRVGGDPAIEIPHEDAYIVDESKRKNPVTGQMESVPGVSPPPKSFDDLISEYGCRAKHKAGHTYVIVDENFGSKRP